MRRYEIVHLIARRLAMKVGRVQAILSRLQESHVISSPGPLKSQPSDMAEPEIVKLLIALLGESGIASSPDASKTFGDLTTADGVRFDMLLSELLFGPRRQVRHLIVRQSPAGISVTVDNAHLLFGDPPSRDGASPARIVPGEAITAIAAELQGQRSVRFRPGLFCCGADGRLRYNLNIGTHKVALALPAQRRIRNEPSQEQAIHGREASGGLLPEFAQGHPASGSFRR